MQSTLKSHNDSQPDIIVTKSDLCRLDDLLSTHATTWSWRAVEFLVRELMRAHVVDEKDAPLDAVTMRSRVVYREDDSEIEQVVTLAYPSDRDCYDDALSVLTPVGAALIGLSEGQSIVYPGPDGRQKTLTVVKIMSQPEHILCQKDASCSLSYGSSPNAVSAIMRMEARHEQRSAGHQGDSDN